MSVFARASRRLAGPGAALGLWLGAVLSATAAPERVVSLNLCTDQLAMLLAAPGQLVSVSFLSRNPMISAMSDRAQGYRVNHGRAEEVFLMRPDLVLAGSYTARPAVRMLRRLGVKVVEFPPERSFTDIRAHLLRMGRLLGQREKAARMVAEFDARLADLRVTRGPRPSVALYGPNGYTTGAGTLADDILDAAGFANIAARAGVPGGGTLPLERLVMLRPDLVVTGARYPGASQAEALLDHPALTALRANLPAAPDTGPEWACGTPHVLDAVAEMRAARDALEAGK